MKTKLFQQRIKLSILDRDQHSWEVADASQPIDEQINQWVEQTGALVSFVSSPGYTVVWVDEQRRTQILMLGVVVLYSESGENDRGTARERDDRERKSADGPTAQRSDNRGEEGLIFG